MLFTLSAPLLSFTAPTKSADAERLNIIMIVTDDQARWSVGTYGNRETRTPNIDRLASEGARFREAFCATPVCSPSRASFLTGRYGTQVGVTDAILPIEAEAGLGLSPASTTWAEVLQRHGYVTALVGKWHLGSKPQFHPTRHGFNHFYGFLGGGTTPLNPTLEVNGKNVQLKGATADLLTDDAMKFIESNRARPFALHLNYREPHLAYTPVLEEDAAPFRDLDPTVPREPGLDIAQVKKFTRDYYASVHSVDRNLGRLLRRLDELNLSGKTIVLFTSDHGYMIGHHGLHTKGNAWWMAGGVRGPVRPNMFEESVRVPLIVRWRGVVKPGTEIVEPVSNIDTFATVLGMLGIPVPAEAKHEGRDFSPLLRNQPIPRRDAIFAQFDLTHGSLAYMRMIRANEWKLVRHYFTVNLDELYNLKDDPGETTNLYNKPAHGDVQLRLQERLTEWMRSIDDPLLRRIPDKK